jgi:hypothetical protein
MIEQTEWNDSSCKESATKNTHWRENKDATVCVSWNYKLFTKEFKSISKRL